MTAKFIQYTSPSLTAINPYQPIGAWNHLQMFPVTTIRDMIAHQSRPAPAGEKRFICDDCKHYKGGCGCRANCFISFVGCNTRDCFAYEKTPQ